MNTRERWSVVADDMKSEEVEAQVVLRNGARFGGQVRGHPRVDNFLHLRLVVDNTASPQRPTVIDHVVDWDEIVALTGTWVAYWSTGPEPTKTAEGQVRA